MLDRGMVDHPRGMSDEKHLLAQHAFIAHPFPWELADCTRTNRRAPTWNRRRRTDTRRSSRPAPAIRRRRRPRTCRSRAAGPPAGASRRTGPRCTAAVGDGVGVVLLSGCSRAGGGQSGSAGVGHPTAGSGRAFSSRIRRNSSRTDRGRAVTTYVSTVALISGRETVAILVVHTTRLRTVHGSPSEGDSASTPDSMHDPRPTSRQAGSWSRSHEMRVLLGRVGDDADVL